jgi:hypothetical protein
MARKLFYICAGMLMLALSFHFGFTTATAQGPGNPVVGVTANQSGVFAATANGDTYQYGNGGPNTWRSMGNIFGGSPTPAQRETWGQLKARYAPSPGTAVPQTSDR